MKNITAQIETDLKNWRGKFLVIINLLDFGIKKIGISNKKAIPKRADNKACLGTSVIVYGKQIAQKYNVMSIPTFMVFNNGGRLASFHSIPEVKKFLQKEEN